MFFKGEVLDRIEADDLPSEAEFVSSLDSRRKAEKVPPLEATEEQLKKFQASNANVPQGPAPARARNHGLPSAGSPGGWPPVNAAVTNPHRVCVAGASGPHGPDAGRGGAGQR